MSEMRQERRGNFNLQIRSRLKSVKKHSSSIKYRAKRRAKYLSRNVAPVKAGRWKTTVQKIKNYGMETTQTSHSSESRWVVNEMHIDDLPVSRAIRKNAVYSCINSWKVERVSPTESLSYSSSSLNAITEDDPGSKVQESVVDHSDHSTYSQKRFQSVQDPIHEMPLIEPNQGVMDTIGCENVIKLKENANSPVEFHHLSGKRYLLVLRHPGIIHFRGTLTVTPIFGTTCILGFEFSPGMKSYLVYSPKGISPLCLATTGQLNTSDYKEMSLKHGLDANILKRLHRRDVALLIEPAYGEQWEQLFGVFSHVLKFNPLTPFRKERDRLHSGLDVERNLGVRFVQPGGCGESKSFHIESADWKVISQEVLQYSCDQGQVRLMVFGGKGVGKSTFMRFMVNQWLSHCKRKETPGVSHDNNGLVVFIDFDPGQSEFMPSGCVSVTLVSEPLLGPNYTHLKDPERMMCVGDLDVGNCPRWYLQCADDLLKFCSSNPELSRLPWFINTMGFCRGIGADLAVKLIHLCHPTHVVQVQSGFKKRNFDPIDMLSCSSVNSWTGTDWNPQVSSEKGKPVPKYFYYQLPSMAERSCDETDIHKSAPANRIASGSEVTEDSQWGLPAWQSRDLCVLAYFSRMVSKPKYSLLTQVPHMMKLSDLTLSLPTPLVSPRFITTAFNARLVALCCHQDPSAAVLQNNSLNNIQGESLRSSDGVIKELWKEVLRPNISYHPSILFHMPLAPCLGYGIVRAIDNLNHELFLTTPLSKQTLALVDCLATSPSIGSIPKELYFEALRMNPRSKFIPYVALDDRSNLFTRTTPRVFQPTLASGSAVKM